MRIIFMYELKKIMCRKLIFISMLISLALILITICAPLLGDYYVDGEYISNNYEMFQTDMAYQKALNDRQIDDALLQEMQEAYAKVPLDKERYSLTEEYQMYARPYSAIFNTIRSLTGLTGTAVLTELDDAKDIYQMRMEDLERDWKTLLLSEKEKAFWKEQENQSEFPMTFQYAEGYNILMSSAYTIGLLCIFIVSVCLANFFPEEHVRKTDQLILCSKYGRKHIFVSKYLVGIVVAGVLSFVLILFTFGITFLIYGIEGFDASFQLIYAQSSCQISVGQAVLILYSMILFASIFVGALVMMLSEVLHSSVGTLSVVIGIIILTMMISVPEEYRLLAQMWNFFPSNVVAVWGTFSRYLVDVFGKLYQTWHVVPVVYLLLGVGAACVTKVSFVKYQVNGR